MRPRHRTSWARRQNKTVERTGGPAISTTVEILAEAFKDAGTPFIVGHPGGESVELMEAARRRQ
ncbi:MAG TPA: hypothetical protein VLX44_09680, partial [Xanthobacteraceae bacterium]|nr:hypothetical protein [Xanthobacteraceae bacterium]